MKTVLKACSILVLSLVALWTTPLYAQSDPDSISFEGFPRQENYRPKVGLVLSGGAARGLAHVGVIKVIEEAGLDVDIVSGVSMGAVVGGLYSLAYDADKLEELALETDWNQLFTDVPKRSDISMEQKFYDEVFAISLPVKDWNVALPSGIIYGQQIGKQLARLTWPVQNVNDFTEFPRPFVCVATDIETGEAVVLTGGSLDKAIRASMSIPTIFAPIEIDGHKLVDGFVARNLPAQDARDLGADILIGVDVGAPLLESDEIDGIVDIINQTMAFSGSRENIRQREMLDLLIVPELDGMSFFAFDKAEEIIRLGEEAARPYFDLFKQLADSLNRIGPPNKLYYPISADSIYISELKIDGLESTTRSIVLGAFGEAVPGWISREKLEAGIDRVYGSNYYDRVSYELTPEPGGTSMRITVVERNTVRLRLGFHYSTDDKAAIIVNLTRFNWLVRGSYSALNIRLGNRTGYDLNYYVGVGREARLGFRFQFAEEALDGITTNPEGVVTPFEMNQWLSNLFVGTLFSTRFVFGGGVYGRTSSIEVGRSEPIDRSILSGYLVGWYDTLDRLNFGTKGSMIRASHEVTLEDLRQQGSELTLTELEMQWNLSLARNVTLQHSLFLSSAQQVNFWPFPVHQIGGYQTLYGLNEGDRAGDNVQIYRLALQVEPWDHRFIVLKADVGRAMDEWSWELDGKGTEGGIGLTIGMLTPIGPISWTTYGGTANEGSTHINIGYIF